MKTTKTKTFGAVAESRRWKQTVARETEGMSCEQVLAYFNKDRLIAALASLRPTDVPQSTAREEPPAV
jgi:hypothetical protein